jgi:propionyl-CoA synthetase
LFLAGERCDPDTLNWATDQLGVPVLDHWWQTETGWPIAGNPLGIELLPIKPGSAGVPVPGYRVDVVDDEGTIVAPDEIGSVVIRLPMPPGTLPTLWNNEAGYQSSYLSRFPGYYLTGDAGFKDADGYLSIMSRIDDIINVAGHRLSTGGMEEILADHPDVAECAVIGVDDDLKGQVPIGFVVLKSGVNRDHAEIVAELVAAVRDRIGPVAAFKQATVVARLPKTRSGKILRSTMRKIAGAQSWSVPATIDDPVILDEIREALATIGYPKP